MIYILTYIFLNNYVFNKIVYYAIQNIKQKKPFRGERTYLGGRSVSNRRPPGPQPGALTN